MNIYLESKDVVFCSIDFVTDKEIDVLKINHYHPASVNDSDWSAPIRDITGLKIGKRTHLESGSNISIIDSPLR